MTAIVGTESHGGVLGPQADPEYARQLTDRIKIAVEGTWHLIAEAYQSRAWSALGYANWDDYCTREFGTARLKLPHEERMGTVKSLRQSGLSLRAIAAATGDSEGTVRNVLKAGAQIYAPVVSGVVVNGMNGEVIDEMDDPSVAATVQAMADEMAASDESFAATAREVTPSKVIGVDGKTYTVPAPTTARRKPITDAAQTLGFDIRKVMERLERLVSDDRLRTNEEQVSRALRGHLLYAADTVAAVLAQIP